MVDPPARGVTSRSRKRGSLAGASESPSASARSVGVLSDARSAPNRVRGTLPSLGSYAAGPSSILCARILANDRPVQGRPPLCQPTALGPALEHGFRGHQQFLDIIGIKRQ